MIDILPLMTSSRSSKRAPSGSRARPLSPARATKRVWAAARSSDLELIWTKHAKKQMADRDLVMGDALYVLKNGYVYDEGQKATRPGLFKYKVQCSTPNSNNRGVRVVAIPSQATAIKIVSVMWADESLQGS